MTNITRLNLTASAGRLLLLVFFFINGLNPLFTEGEIIPFDENVALNFYGNFNIVNFASKENRSYTSASPWSIGLGIRYKNISARLFLPLWFENNPFDIQLNSYYEKVYYEFFSDNIKTFTGMKILAAINTLFPVLIFYRPGYLPIGFKTISGIPSVQFIILIKNRPNQAGVFCTVLAFFILP
jgi:hypothetical protein